MPPPSRAEKSRGCQRVVYYSKNGFLIVLRAVFKRLGRLVGAHPYVFILLTLLSSSISIGMKDIRFAQRLRDGFTPVEAPSTYEDAVNVEFHESRWAYAQRFIAVVRAADNGSLLRPAFLKRVVRLHDFLFYDFNISVDGSSFTYGDLCDPYCAVNTPLLKLQESQEKQLLAIERGKKVASDVIIDYPKMLYHGLELNMAMNLFGVKKANNTNSFQRIDSVSLVIILFYAEAPDDNVTNIITHWEIETFNWAKEGAKEFPDLIIDVLGDKILGQEMIRGGMSLLPYLVFGFGLMVIFVITTIVGSAIYHQRMDGGKALIAFGTLASPLLACTTTFGILTVAGYEMYPMQMVIPFLILAIGVDDAFLMVHAWHRLSRDWDHLSKEHRRQAIPEMLGKVFEDVGPSITITSLTNAVAFGIGTTVSTPAIQLFCTAASVAMTIDFIFELILFGSLMSLSARFEFPGDQVKLKKDVRARIRKCGLDALTRYCEMLTTKRATFVVYSFAALFFAASLFGTLRARTYINSQKIMPGDTPLLRADALLEQYLWKEYEPLHVFVNRPPDISNATEYSLLMQMVEEYEALPNAIGPDATILWLREYVSWLKDNFFRDILGIPATINYDDLPTFLESDFHKPWSEFIKWHVKDDDEETVVVSQFYFITGYKNASSWMARVEMMELWRETAVKWARFNVTVFQPNAPVYDAITYLKPSTIQTVGFTLASMLVVCALFIPNCAGVITAGWAICSISIGVFGFLSWWGLDLDPVTMSAILMSIGFSVDFTAHVSYHYQSARLVLPFGHSKTERLVHTLDSVAWPMIQAGASTVIVFIPVVFHRDYTPSVFVKTIVLVVGWGLLHGLILLPAILASLPDCCFIDGINDTKRAAAIAKEKDYLPDTRRRATSEHAADPNELELLGNVQNTEQRNGKPESHV